MQPASFKLRFKDYTGKGRAYPPGLEPPRDCSSSSNALIVREYKPINFPVFLPDYNEEEKPPGIRAQENITSTTLSAAAAHEGPQPPEQQPPHSEAPKATQEQGTSPVICS